MKDPIPRIKPETDENPDYSAERKVSELMVAAASETLGELRSSGSTRKFKPHEFWAGPSFEETTAVALSDETIRLLQSFGYQNPKQAYLIQTGSFGDGSYRGFGGAYVPGNQTDYEVRILTGAELGKNDTFSNPEAFLGRDFASISPDCPVRYRNDTTASGNSEVNPAPDKTEALMRILDEIRSGRPTTAEEKYVASSL